jgi:hypothetical protein
MLLPIRGDVGFDSRLGPIGRFQMLQILLRAVPAIGQNFVRALP